MPDVVNLRRDFHAFTGLQCRSWRYLYLLACIVVPRNRHLPPVGRFRRFVIRFCGSTYNTARHLKMISGVTGFRFLKSIRREIYQIRIQRKWIANGSFGSILGFFVRFSGPADLTGKMLSKTRMAAKRGRSAVRINGIFRREDPGMQPFLPDMRRIREAAAAYYNEREPEIC